MTTALKTKCPKCAATFDVSSDVTSKPKARARCGQCQHIFFVNEHLEQDEDEMLIRDDVSVHDNDDDDEPETDLKEASVDDMSDWINKASNSTANNAGSTKKARSSIEENSIDSNSVSVNEDENAWLEKLLQEEQSQVDPNLSRTQTNSTDEDLTKLLSDFGIQTVAPAMPSKEETLARMNARLKKDAASKAHVGRQSAMASFLWVLGCLSLVLLLLAQYVIFNLDTLIKNPEYAAKLHSVCDIVACSLPEADLTQLSISHLTHRPSTVNSAATQSDIIAALINKSNQDQLYPNLNVKLYGTDTMLGEFIAAPEEYLSPAQRLLPAKQPQLLMFTVPVSDEQISRVEITPLY